MPIPAAQLGTVGPSRNQWWNLLPVASCYGSPPWCQRAGEECAAGSSFAAVLEIIHQHNRELVTNATNRIAGSRKM